MLTSDVDIFFSGCWTTNLRCELLVELLVELLGELLVELLGEITSRTTRRITSRNYTYIYVIQLLPVH